MSRPKISIVMGTYERAEFLWRSLGTYFNQPFKDFELIVLDDWSTDHTEEFCTQTYSSAMNIVYIKPPWKQPGTWRDSASILNLGLRAAKGDLVLLTHPEVMMDKYTLQKMWDRFSLAGNSMQDQNDYFCAKPYYLTPYQQSHIDEVYWSMDFTDAIRNIPTFYDDAPIIAGNPDYRPKTIEQISHWDSWVFGGMSRSLWHRIGGMAEYDSWGSIDLDFLDRRRLLGIRNITLDDLDTFVVHQNHDSIQGSGRTPRDMNLAMSSVPRYTAETAILHNL